MQTAGPTSGAIRTALGMRAQSTEGRARGGSEQVMADAQEEGLREELLSMVEIMTPMTSATLALSSSGTVTAVRTSITPDNK
jgi:hypothetical protein